jgi:uncharacterized protein YciI
MYALAIVRYRKPFEEVLKHREDHLAYLRDLKAKGLLIAAGPFDPRNGGALLLRVPDSASLDAIRDEDPYVLVRCAQYELLPWLPVIGLEDLDRL